MADASISLGSVNLFGLSAEFKPQPTLVQTESPIIGQTGATGLSVVRKRLPGVTRYTQTYQYCGTDMKADLGGNITSFGHVHDATGVGYGPVKIDSMEFSFTASAFPFLTIRGHNHTDTPHILAGNTTDISGFVPASGFGVPDMGVTLGADCSPFLLVMRFLKEHLDVNEADGTHIYGMDTQGCVLDMEMAFAGIPISTTEDALEADIAVAGFDFKVRATTEAQSNRQFDSFAFVAKGYANT